MASTSGSHLSKEFFELIKAIGESRSKQEEDRIIAREVVVLKNKLSPWKKQKATPAGYRDAPGPASLVSSGPLSSSSQNPNFNTKKKNKEFLVRLLYVEMLGHDGSFGYIKAVELAASTNITQKRVGYLLCGACLSPENEFRFMLVNQMQRDLNSANVLENCAALLAVTRIITSDMVPAVSGDVSKLLSHASETVRKKAIVALHRLYQLNDEAVPALDFVEKVRRVLCDRDPAVMGASLCVIESMCLGDPLPFKDLVSSLVSILKQICEHRLPSEFDYHRMPAPWMQMQILRILAILGRGDANASSDCYEVVSDCLKRADVGANAGYAVVYECVRTITRIYPNPTLLDAAAESISRFIGSRSHNLKYLGVTGLASIVEQHPRYAAAHQMAVIECLEDRDETLQRKTLELLYKMTNPVNVEFITDKLLAFLRDTTDPFLKQDLTVRITKIAERYAPSQEWYVRSVTSLFEISGDLVSPEVANNLMSLIAEGEEDEDEEVNVTLRRTVVELYAGLLQSGRKLPKTLAETVAWVLGEYAYLSTEHDLSDVLEMLCDLASRAKGGTGTLATPTTKRFLVGAIMKLVAQLGTCPPSAAHVIDDFTRSSDVDLQQRCLEFQNMLTSAPHVLGEILPVDASCEDVGADETLAFLDDFVREAEANGAPPYSPPEDDDEDDDLSNGGGTRNGTRRRPVINVTPYEKPKTPGEAQFDLNKHNATRSTGGVSGQISGSYGQAAHGDSHSSGFSATGGVAAVPGGGTGAGGATSGGSGGGDGGGGGEPQLIVRNVANVWGKPQPASAAPAAPAATPNPPSPDRGYGAPSAPAPAPASSTYGGYGGGYGQSNQSIPPSQPRELTEKERMAAQLFGGMVPGQAAPPPAPAPAPVSSVRPAAAAVPAAPAPAPPPAPAPAPAPAAAEVDLLDMMSFGDATPAAPAPPASIPSSDSGGGGGGGLDVLAPTPVSSAPAPAAPAPPPAPAPAPPVNLDPFAAEGLLGDLSDKPLSGLSPTSTRFRHDNGELSPLPITTAQFGQMWGTFNCTNPVSVTSSTKVTSLDGLMETFVSGGAHMVETIAATNEGIAAGSVGGTNNVLIHGKVTPQAAGGTKLDVTVKSTDAALGGSLATFFANKLR